MTWLYLYVGGAVLTFAFQLGSLILGMQRGDASITWRTNEGRTEVLIDLFHGLFASAVIWPLSLVLSARKGMQMIRAEEPFEFSISEDRLLRYPPHERLNAEVVKLRQSLAPALNEVCTPSDEALAVAAVLLEFAWQQVDCEAHGQGVSTKVAATEMLRLVRFVTRHGPAPRLRAFASLKDETAKPPEAP